MFSLRNEDTRLVRRCLKGDRSAFDRLVERYFHAVYAVAYAHTRHHADAEDVTQQAFLQAYARLDGLRDTRRFEGWVVSIARNAANALHRRRAPEDLPPNLHSTIESSAPEREELNEIVGCALNDLDATSREVLLLHYFAGNTTKEIAGVLDVSQSAVLKRLQRARERLGERLLTDFSDTFAPTKTPADQKRAIASSVAAAATSAWAASSGTSTASASVYAFGKTSAIAAGMTSVGVAALVTWSTVTANRPNEADLIAVPPVVIAAIADPEKAQEDTVLPASSVDVDEAQKSGEAEASIDGTPEPASPPEPTGKLGGATIGESDDAYRPLDGLWRVTIRTEESDAELAFELQLVERGATIGVSSVSGAVPVIRGQGTLAGQSVNVRLGMLDGDSVEYAAVDLSGNLSSERDAMTLEGTITQQLQYDPKLIAVSARLVRLDGDALSRRGLLVRYTREVQELAYALRAYRKAHYPKLPLQLDELVPLQLPDDTLVENTEERKFEYRPKSMGPGSKGLPSYSDYVAEPNALHPELSAPDRLIRFEQACVAYWGGQFMSTGPILIVRYPDYEIVLSVDASFSVREYAGVETRDPSPASDQQRARWRASCANNLKQLGLSMKMFQNENPDELYPPGPHSVYPEYMVDTRVLSCPSSDPSEISYEFVYPAVNDAFINEIASAVTGLTREALGSSALSLVPIVFETHECSASAGRNVLFPDGHVEFILDENWETRVEPYLDFE